MAEDIVMDAINEATEDAAQLVDETVATAEEAIAETDDTVKETVADIVTETAEAVSEAEETVTEAEEHIEDIKEGMEDIAETSEDIEEATTESAESASSEKRKTLLASLEGVLSDEFKAKPADIFEDEKTEEKKVAFELPEEFRTEEPEEEEVVETDEEPPVILFDHVHKEYEGQVKDSVALTDVSFSIKKGEFVFIVGPSGSGKSTMIRLMMREITPSEGKIYIAGKELAKLRRRHISKYRRNIGIVFQDFRLLPDRNVFDNVAFAQRAIGARKSQIPKEVSKVLHLVGIANKYKSFPNELSGGEQQRVAIARALVNNPMIILADEPTGNLDPENSYEIMSLLEEINRRGTTVVVVTHDHEIVDRMQKRVIALNDGTIVDDKKGGYSRG